MAIYIDQRAETEDIEGYKFTAWLHDHLGPCRSNNPCRSVKKRAISSPDGSHGFTYFDTDQDGEITKRELANVLNLTEENVQKYFGIFDIDEDGKITRDEFYTMAAPSYEIDQ